MHAEVRIGDSRVMMGEPVGDFGPMPACIYVYVNNTDAVYQRALQAGATSIMEPADQFYGDRNAASRTPAATSGGSARTSRTCRPRNWHGAPRLR